VVVALVGTRASPSVPDDTESSRAGVVGELRSNAALATPSTPAIARGTRSNAAVRRRDDASTTFDFGRSRGWMIVSSSARSSYYLARVAERARRWRSRSESLAGLRVAARSREARRGPVVTP